MGSPARLDRIDFGDLRRTTPVSRVFGLDRGRCIDRYYIENFLAEQARLIRGQVLEIGDDTYTRAFGGDKVTQSDVLHIQPGQPGATLCADLGDPACPLPANSFDCIIFTQTLLVIYDVHAAMANLHRILRPGGAVLGTFPGICQISRYDMDRWGDYWRFTELSARRLFSEAFEPQNITIRTWGNVLVAASYLYGLAAEELATAELDETDPDYPIVITLTARKE